MFYSNNTYQTRYFAKTWQKALRRREIEKNNYRATGDLKKAKDFVTMVTNYTFPLESEKKTTFEQTIFSSERVAVPLGLVYTFAY